MDVLIVEAYDDMIHDLFKQRRIPYYVDFFLTGDWILTIPGTLSIGNENHYHWEKLIYSFLEIK